MKLIEEKELEQLIDDSLRLACLEEAGVDNWEGYDEAFNPEFTGAALKYRDFSRMNTKEAVKDYKDA